MLSPVGMCRHGSRSVLLQLWFSSVSEKKRKGKGVIVRAISDSALEKEAPKSESTGPVDCILMESESSDCGPSRDHEEPASEQWEA